MSELRLSEDALAALKATGYEPPDKPERRLPMWMQYEIREQVRETFFGPTKKPPFRVQCLGWTAFRAITAVWACDNWVAKMEEKFG